MNPRTTHTMFLDETGSTGDRLLSPDQPLFAHGGWIIAHEDRARATQTVEHLESSAGCGTSELKGSKLIKHWRGQSLIRRVADAIGQFAVPYVYVVEKRFSICAKIVDTFFDPAFNPATPWEERTDPDLLQTQAQDFYETASPLIEEFAEAFRLYDPKAVRSNAEQWVEALRASGRAGMADKVQAAFPNLEDQIEKEGRTTDVANLPAGFDSLNLPIVHCAFQFIEEQSPFACDIVHDQTASLEPIFRYVYELYAKAEPQRFVMRDGRATVTGYRKIGGLTFADSAKEPLIRAADFSLNAVRRFISSALKDEAIPENVTRGALPHLGGILISILPGGEQKYPLPMLGGVMASGEWVGKVFQRLVKEMQGTLKMG